MNVSRCIAQHSLHALDHKSISPSLRLHTVLLVFLGSVVLQ